MQIIQRTLRPMENDRKQIFRDGIRDGIPIALGYFVVSFTLGIVARKAGLTPFDGFITSFLNNASAGEYAAFVVMESDAPYLEMALITLVANARYLLMSIVVSQKFSADTSLIHRVLVGFDLTDEIFGITIARKGKLEPIYNYGAMFVALPGWSVGTALGIFAGNVLPMNVVSALGVALYGMFLVIIIPPGKLDKVILWTVIASFVLSLIATDIFADISSGTRTIILTILISSIVAYFFPIKEPN